VPRQPDSAVVGAGFALGGGDEGVHRLVRSHGAVAAGEGVSDDLEVEVDVLYRLGVLQHGPPEGDDVPRSGRVARRVRRRRVLVDGAENEHVALVLEVLVLQHVHQPELEALPPRRGQRPVVHPAASSVVL
jgi:hypothetical protein